jgi:hypothetical protein
MQQHGGIKKAGLGSLFITTCNDDAPGALDQLVGSVVSNVIYGIAR